MKVKVQALIAGTRDLRSVNEVHRRLGGRRKTVLEAMTELEERGRIAKPDGVFVLLSEKT